MLCNVNLYSNDEILFLGLKDDAVLQNLWERNRYKQTKTNCIKVASKLLV